MLFLPAADGAGGSSIRGRLPALGMARTAGGAADIAVGCCLGWVEFRKPGGIEWRGESANLARFYDKLMERPVFADTAPKL